MDHHFRIVIAYEAWPVEHPVLIGKPVVCRTFEAERVIERLKVEREEGAEFTVHEVESTERVNLIDVVEYTAEQAERGW